MLHRKDSGFVLASCVLPIGIGALLFSIGWHGQSGPRVSPDDIVANERAAIATLRTIVAAQATLASSGAIDTDADGVGEFGYFGELAGSAWLRIYDSVDDAPGLGRTNLTPPLLPSDFAEILIDARVENVVLKDGYFFKLFLPDVTFAHSVEGIAEDGPPGIGGVSGALFPDSDNGESLWCCYAWPSDAQVTGRRAFFVNQKGYVLQTKNDGRPTGGPVYDGMLGAPRFGAAYSDAAAAPGGLTGMGAPLGNRSPTANDGNVWTLAGR